MKNASFFSTICLILLFNLGCKSKSNDSFIFDYAMTLTKAQAHTLDSLFQSHEIKTSNEIVLVTTNDYGHDSTIKLYAKTFGNNHGIGKKKTNNGLVIVFNGSEHQVAISTGTGTEMVFKDEIAKLFIDSLMVPQFKEGKIYEGLWNGSKAIVDFLERPENKIK